MDFASRHSGPLGIGLVSNVDHAGLALLIEMSKLVRHEEIISYADT